jgi:hypothetical protein
VIETMIRWQPFSDCILAAIHCVSVCFLLLSSSSIDLFVPSCDSFIIESNTANRELFAHGISARRQLCSVFHVIWVHVQLIRSDWLGQSATVADAPFVEEANHILPPVQRRALVILSCGRVRS